MNSDENSYYVGIDTSVPSSSTIPLADPPAVVVIEATGLQRIWNVIVFAVATLHIVVIFVFLLPLHLLAKSSAPAARADLAIAFETPPIPPFVHLSQIDIFLHHLSQVDIFCIILIRSILLFVLYKAIN